MTMALMAFVPSPEPYQPVPVKPNVLISSLCDQWRTKINNDPKLRDQAHYKPFMLGGQSHHNDNNNFKKLTYS